MKRIACGACLFAICFAFFGCASDKCAEWREYKVYCGMSSPSGEVSEEAWARFCDRCVSAAFPDGYTVIDATGYWRAAPDTTKKERAKIILVVAPADAREKVLLVAKQYSEQFSQSAVLVSASDAETELVEAPREPK